MHFVAFAHRRLLLGRRSASEQFGHQRRQRIAGVGASASVRRRTECTTAPPQSRLDRSNDFLRIKGGNAEKPEGFVGCLAREPRLRSPTKKVRPFPYFRQCPKNPSLDHDSARGAASAAKPRSARCASGLKGRGTMPDDRSPGGIHYGAASIATGQI